MIMSLKENIQNNKAKAWYFAGIIIAACLKEVFAKVQEYLPENTLWGDVTLIVSGYAIVAVSLIAPLIFGNDGAIERVKMERKENGEEVTRLLTTNHGLDITNKLQADVREENGLTPYRYEGINKKEKNVGDIKEIL